ncbi:unnamed protein product [marine sediment metagenome]|uniref:Uncharacterized protein n=1 Tax=marine sediment metagenome TaxID=412755 RepID=X1T8S1_9ZZZZ
MPKLPKFLEETKLAKIAEEGIDFLPELKIPSPFGTVKLPKYGFPPLKPPKIDERRRKALGHAAGVTAAQVIGLVPWVGDAAADVIEDLHGKEIKKILTPKEYERYLVEDKVAPSIVALIRTFIKQRV